MKNFMVFLFNEIWLEIGIRNSGMTTTLKGLTSFADNE